MKVGDIIKYGHSKYYDGRDVTGLVIYINAAGGTVRVVDQFGRVDWFVTSQCEIISESR